MWVAVGDIQFEVAAKVGDFLMVDENHGYLASACTPIETEECPRCHKTVPAGEVRVRYSYTVYAGRFCDDCCLGYRDNCGVQGNPQELDEELGEYDPESCLPY